MIDESRIKEWHVDQVNNIADVILAILIDVHALHGKTPKDETQSANISLGLLMSDLWEFV